jgi:hypothetical protein
VSSVVAEFYHLFLSYSLFKSQLLYTPKRPLDRFLIAISHCHTERAIDGVRYKQVFRSTSSSPYQSGN